MTPSQVEMFVAATSLRRNNEIISNMSISAAASSAAYTGSTEPLENIEKSIRGVSTSYGGELKNRLRGLLGAGVKVR